MSPAVVLRVYQISDAAVAVVVSGGRSATAVGMHCQTAAAPTNTHTQTHRQHLTTHA